MVYSLFLLRCLSSLLEGEVPRLCILPPVVAVVGAALAGAP